ncbi:MULTISPECIES: NAD(P)-dependent alcohol dehydrogenase [Streptomyces]|uniref:NAD(P)-dependent alcohol dehydrogenase n=1 Tax=Streptomyces lycopersici TaxID=2974589 RepID=UPI0021D1E132|nr:NAD(P)-dependent alcohol dehydrogenase [Streptomyces sp. NEAU-383]
MTTTVKAYAVPAANAPLEPTTIERRSVREHDVLIEIKYCGVCRSDIHQAHGDWPGGTFPMVPGHEITGIVTEIGSSVTRYKVGDRVGIGCFVDSCRECEHCLAGEEQFCLKGQTGTYNAVGRDGELTYGGYSTHIVADENYVLRIPEGIALDEAAPLLCAGITLYSPLKLWGAGPGKKVAIVGLGGLGHMGVKIAHALGAEVTVLSHSEGKQEDAKRLGADHFHSTSDDSVFEVLEGTFDLIVNTTSADLPLGAYLSALRVGGTMVNVSAPPHAVALHLFALIARRKRLVGSMMGGIRETQEMLDFCAAHGFGAEIELISAGQINEAFDRVLKSDVRYRFVIDASTI